MQFTLHILQSRMVNVIRICCITAAICVRSNAFSTLRTRTVGQQCLVSVITAPIPHQHQHNWDGGPAKMMRWSEGSLLLKRMRLSKIFMTAISSPQFNSASDLPRLIWYQLIDSRDGQPYKATSADKVSVSSNADVADFRKAAQAECGINPDISMTFQPEH